MIFHSIDIETMSVQRNAAITQIGIATFSGVGPKMQQKNSFSVDYEIYLRKDSPSEYSLFDIDNETMSWWAEQSDDAIASAFKTGNEAISLSKALEAVSSHILDYSRSAKIWANPPAFDLAILRHAFGAFNLPVPWHYRQEHCLRTLRSLFPKVGNLPFHGVKHDALADAQYQGEQVVAAMILQNRCNSLHNH